MTNRPAALTNGGHFHAFATLAFLPLFFKEFSPANAHANPVLNIIAAPAWMMVRLGSQSAPSFHNGITAL